MSIPMLLQLASLFIAIVAVLGAQSSVRIAAIPSSQSMVHGSQIDLDGVPELSAQSAFLIDTQSGRILYEKNADEKRPIASITKLMTALVVLDYIENNPPQSSLTLSEGAENRSPLRIRGDGGVTKWQDHLTFEAQDRRNGGIPYLIPGEQITAQDAWKLMLVGSSNDAAALLARAVVGNEATFVEAMNSKARALGLRHTVFADPTGLHAGNISTAREIAALTRFALGHPEIRGALGMRQFQFVPQGRAPRTVRSTNWLLGASVVPGGESFGGKTGHIEASGYNFAFAQGKDERELVGVLLGAETNEARFREMRELLVWGFNVVQE